MALLSNVPAFPHGEVGRDLTSCCLPALSPNHAPHQLNDELLMIKWSHRLIRQAVLWHWPSMRKHIGQVPDKRAAEIKVVRKIRICLLAYREIQG